MYNCPNASGELTCEVEERKLHPLWPALPPSHGWLFEPPPQYLQAAWNSQWSERNWYRLMQLQLRLEEVSWKMSKSPVAAMEKWAGDQAEDQTDRCCTRFGSRRRNYRDKMGGRAKKEGVHWFPAVLSHFWQKLCGVHLNCPSLLLTSVCSEAVLFKRCLQWWYDRCCISKILHLSFLMWDHSFKTPPIQFTFTYGHIKVKFNVTFPNRICLISKFGIISGIVRYVVD